MITIRRAEDRGATDFGWLDSRHTFSFGDYHDPEQMGFRALRVINDDRVAGGSGFPRHGHRDIEILSWVLEGGLAHEDSLGTGSTIRPGDLQKMSAGTGVLHSEFNASRTELAHFLQIWILPERPGLPATYDQKHFEESQRRGVFRRIASGSPAAGEVKIFQDVDLHTALLAAGEAVEHRLAASRHAWLHVARGAVALNGRPLVEGDGAAISEEARLSIAASAPSEILLFDLA